MTANCQVIGESTLVARPDHFVVKCLLSASGVDIIPTHDALRNNTTKFIEKLTNEIGGPMTFDTYNIASTVVDADNIASAVVVKDGEPKRIRASHTLEVGVRDYTDFQKLSLYLCNSSDVEKVTHQFFVSQVPRMKKRGVEAAAQDAAEQAQSAAGMLINTNIELVPTYVRVVRQYLSGEPFVTYGVLRKEIEQNKYQLHGEQQLIIKTTVDVTFMYVRQTVDTVPISGNNEKKRARE
jgi:hypothetical protein